jgi:Flp pilus assembly protein TadG
MVAGWRRRAGRRDERGASAVEFALILPLLMVMIFGIIDYGFFFFDSIGLRQGSREAARAAVVLRVDTGACGTTVSYANIACTAREGSNNVLGQGSPRVKVKMYINMSAPNTSNAWKQGNQFVVCTQVAEDAITGLVPFPNGGIMKSKTVMSIEKDSAVPSGSLVSDAAPSGGSWSWC